MAVFHISVCGAVSTCDGTHSIPGICLFLIGLVGAPVSLLPSGRLFCSCTFLHGVPNQT
jgi:hypothetical protein